MQDNHGHFLDVSTKIKHRMGHWFDFIANIIDDDDVTITVTQVINQTFYRMNCHKVYNLWNLPLSFYSLWIVVKDIDNSHFWLWLSDSNSKH
jgi:hypothetical protein